MARLIEKDEIKSKGPWLLTKMNLDELNKIFEGADSLLETSYNEEVNQEIEKEFQSSYYTVANTSKDEIRKKVVDSYAFRVERKASIITNDNQTLEGGNLMDLLKAKALESIRPARLKIELKKASSEIYFTFSDSTFFGGIEFVVKVENESLNEDIIYSIKSWIEKYKSKKAIKIWSNFGTIGAFLFYLLCFFCYLTYLGTNTPYDKYNTDLNKDANILLDSGIKPGEERRALELLLKFKAGYIPKKYYVGEPKIDFLSNISLIYIAIAILLSIRTPKPFIGLGKNESQARFRNWWYKAITISVPTIIFIPWLRELLNHILGVY